MPCYGGCNYITTELLKSNLDTCGVITHHCITCGCKYNDNDNDIENTHKHIKENTICVGQKTENNIIFNMLKCNEIGCKYYYLIPQ